MNEKDFVALCKKTVVESVNEQITEDDVYIVWLCKTLQNSKALASTTLPDGKYYELTYDGDRGKLYVDTYEKQSNACIKL